MPKDQEPKLLYPVYARGEKTFPDHWVGAEDGTIVQNHELKDAERDGYVQCLDRQQRKQILKESAEQKRQEKIKRARDRADERRIDNLRKLMGMVMVDPSMFQKLTEAGLRPSDALDPDNIPNIVSALHKSDIKDPKITDEGSFLGNKSRTTTFIDPDSLPRPNGSIQIDKISLSDRTINKLSTPIKKPLAPLTSVINLVRNKFSGRDIETEEADEERPLTKKQQRNQEKAREESEKQLLDIQKAYLYGRGSRKIQAQSILTGLEYECFEGQIVKRGLDSDHITCIGPDGNIMNTVRNKSAIEKRVSGIFGRIIK